MNRLIQYWTFVWQSAALLAAVNLPAFAHEAGPHVHTGYWNSVVVVAVLLLVFGVLGNKFSK
ncbi:MAG: hypothetical protein COB04_02555 [Gammaproteobacteria bacterium]|nr:MAG: hypothetical protein COB04_02555 [Gammaproteobacteria bacterium]